MERINIDHSYVNFVKAHNALKKSIVAVNNQWENVSKELHETLVAGVLQHFELTYETSWKFLKNFLAHTHNVEVASPKNTFKMCYERGLIYLSNTQ